MNIKELNKFTYICVFCISFYFNYSSQSINKPVKEVSYLSKDRLIQLNVFLNSKEFKKTFKRFYHCKPFLNYCNQNLNYNKSCLHKLDSIELQKINYNSTLNTNDSMCFWSDVNLLNMRKWCKKSKYYIVFSKPENNIVSFYILRSNTDILNKIKYISETHLCSNYLLFSILLNDKSYKLLCWSGSIKG